MQRKNILANMLLSVDKIENNENGVGVLNCRDTENNPMKISLYIEKDETVKDFTQSKYRDASLEEWDRYLNTLVSANFDEVELIKSYNEQLSKRSDAIDIKIEEFEEIEASRDLTDEESVSLKGLKAEKREIRAAKENPNSYLEAKKEEILKLVEDKKIFMFAGVNRKINNDGSVSYAAELPHPMKTLRNVKSPKKGIIMDYTVLNSDNEIITLKDVKDDTLVEGNLKLRGNISKNNTIENIEAIFNVNSNAIDQILNNEKYGSTFYSSRLLNVYGKTEVSRELYEFKKDNKFEDLNFEKIEKLKDFYNRVKEDILQNGLGNYDLSIEIIKNPKKNQELKTLAKQFGASLEDGLIKKLVKGEVDPSVIKMEKITGIQDIPSKMYNGINVADQFYISKEFAPNIYPSNKEVFNKKEVEMYGSVKVIEKIDKECGIEIKKNEIKHSEQEVEDVNGMER